MDNATLPPRFPIPWAYGAGGAYIRPIPTNSQIGIQNGAASLTDGFPPLNFDPVAAGGVPPFGQDMNGILNQITRWNQRQQAGAVSQWNSSFSTSISGYPKYATLASTTYAGILWVNQADNNTTNPETGGANWDAVRDHVYHPLIWDTNLVSADGGYPINAVVQSSTRNRLQWISTANSNTTNPDASPGPANWQPVYPGAFYPLPWSLSLSQAANGYPKNAMVSSNTTDGKYWMSTVNNNTTDPDTGGAGWVPFYVYSSSLTGTGWARMPGGMIIQWGQWSGTTGALDGNGIAETVNVVINLPLTFPNGVLSCVVTADDVTGAGNQEIAWYCGAIDTSHIAGGLSCRTAFQFMSAQFIAIGY